MRSTIRRVAAPHKAPRSRACARRPGPTGRARGTTIVVNGRLRAAAGHDRPRLEDTVFRRSQRVRPPVSDDTTSEKARERFTYIHHGTTLTGDVKARGRVRVHGAVHGEVEVDGLLEVAKDGVVDGASIVAEALVVLGRVRGAVRVSGKVEVWKGGVLEGDVRAGSLDIEDGATFVGRSEMSLPDGPPQLGAPSAAAGADAGDHAGEDAGDDAGSGASDGAAAADDGSAPGSA
jgi:cytoskeletal protein CcmA (bactofilin family)